MRSKAMPMSPTAPMPRSHSPLQVAIPPSKTRARPAIRARTAATAMTIRVAGSIALLQRLWAAGMLGVLSVWLVYSHARSPFTLRQMNPRLVGPLDWAYYFTGAAAWLYIAACVGQRWSIKL